ncbi:MAG TPA: hypothetical protein VIN08_06045 [Ohtaekwangia sp.]|uniref:hypothetical protein n=1 Tax=Ohtaekwangia sp. TaxID=2066019 RepID=UPI002F94455C
MKAFLLALLVLIIAVPVSAQYNQTFASLEKSTTVAATSPIVVKPQGEGTYKVFMPPGLRMRNAGRTLTILGGAMLIGGVIVFSSADETYYTTTTTNNGTYEEGDPKAALGIVMIAGGLGMSIPGVILWTKGAKKYKRYMEQHEGEQTVSFDLKGNGLALRYRF